MSSDCTDVCNVVYESMCLTCPKNEECHGPMDEDKHDHDEMISCLINNFHKYNEDEIPLTIVLSKEDFLMQINPAKTDKIERIESMSESDMEKFIEQIKKNIGETDVISDAINSALDELDNILKEE